MLPCWLKRVIGPWGAPIILLLMRVTGRRAGLALLYHEIDDRQGTRERELIPAVESGRFRQELRHLSRYYEIVPAESFLQAIASRRRGGRFPLCLTFDDDASQHATHALPALQEAGVPATFFLSGTFLDARPQSFWWHRLQRAIDRGVAPETVSALLPPHARVPLDGSPSDIHRLAEQITRGLTPGERGEVTEALLPLAGPDAAEDLLSPSGAGALAGAGFGIGFHTRRHDALTGLDDSSLERALEDAREDLARFAGRPVDAIAYPHGIVDARVAAAARRAGFTLGFTYSGASATPASDPLLLGRHEPGPVSLGEFALSIARALSRADRPLTPDRAAPPA
jgi:peptidoglycan/xylan/chitin deacetylase (PgdA/CDA1 family)